MYYSHYNSVSNTLNATPGVIIGNLGQYVRAAQQQVRAVGGLHRSGQDMAGDAESESAAINGGAINARAPMEGTTDLLFRADARVMRQCSASRTKCDSAERETGQTTQKT